jgi:malate/lactate dehydrogenase
VGLSIREVVHSLALDARRVLPVSTLQMGSYGLRDVCLSVPTIVGCGGALRHVELPLTQKERLGLMQSARVLREIIQQVESRLNKPGVSPGNARASGNGSGRVIPRTAWQKKPSSRT